MRTALKKNEPGMFTPLSLASSFEPSPLETALSAARSSGWMFNPEPLAGPSQSDPQLTFGEDPYLCSVFTAAAKRAGNAEPKPLDPDSVTGIMVNVALSNTVLLKNNRQVLPLTGRYLRKILFCGEYSSTLASMFARNSSAHAVDHVGEGYTSAEAAARAATADAVVMCSCGDCSGAKLEMFEGVVKSGNPVILAAFGDVPPDTPDLFEKSSAFIWAWNYTKYHDAALTRILLGEANPSGRLPLTITPGKREKQLRDGYEDAPAFPLPEDGGSYLYMRREPLYPFGIGLSYTRFVYRDLNVYAGKDGTVTVTCRAENAGMTGGFETAQLYFRRGGAAHTRTEAFSAPRWQLVHASRFYLAPGEYRDVEITLGGFAEERGRCAFFVGGHQPDARSVWLSETPVLSAFVTL